MATSTVITIIAVTVIVTAFIVHWRRSRVESFYDRYKFISRLVAALVGFLIAWTLLHTGDPLLMAVAVVGIALATVYYIIEKPHEDVV